MEAVRDLLNATLSQIMAGWMDSLLQDAGAAMRENGLNDFALPPEEVEYTQEVLGMKLTGVASIYDGALRGLDTIHRTGPVAIATEPSSGDWIADFELGVDNASLKAMTTAKFMNMGPTADIVGGIDKVRVKMAVRASLSLSGLETSLEKFEMAELGKLSMDVDGLGGVMNFLVEIIVETLGNKYRQELRVLLEGKVKEILSELVTHPPSIPNMLSLVQSSYSNILDPNSSALGNLGGCKTQ